MFIAFCKNSFSLETLKQNSLNPPSIWNPAWLLTRIQWGAKQGGYSFSVLWSKLKSSARAGTSVELRLSVSQSTANSPLALGRENRKICTKETGANLLTYLSTSEVITQASWINKSCTASRFNLQKGRLSEAAVESASISLTVFDWEKGQEPEICIWECDVENWSGKAWWRCGWKWSDTARIAQQSQVFLTRSMSLKPLLKTVGHWPNNKAKCVKTVDKSDFSLPANWLSLEVFTRPRC